MPRLSVRPSARSNFSSWRYAAPREIYREPIRRAEQPCCGNLVFAVVVAVLITVPLLSRPPHFLKHLADALPIVSVRFRAPSVGAFTERGKQSSSTENEIQAAPISAPSGAAALFDPADAFDVAETTATAAERSALPPTANPGAGAEQSDGQSSSLPWMQSKPRLPVPTLTSFVRPSSISGPHAASPLPSQNPISLPIPPLLPSRLPPELLPSDLPSRAPVSLPSPSRSNVPSDSASCQLSDSRTQVPSPSQSLPPSPTPTASVSRTRSETPQASVSQSRTASRSWSPTSSPSRSRPQSSWSSSRLPISSPSLLPSEPASPLPQQLPSRQPSRPQIPLLALLFSRSSSQQLRSGSSSRPPNRSLSKSASLSLPSQLPSLQPSRAASATRSQTAPTTRSASHTLSASCTRSESPSRSSSRTPSATRTSSATLSQSASHSRAATLTPSVSPKLRISIPVAAGTRLALPGGDPWAPRLVLVTCSNEYYADRRKQIVAAAQSPKCQGIFSRIIEHNETTITALPGYDDIVKPMIETYFRGWGYWAWKPLVVLDALKGLADDEALVYLDSGQSLHCNNVNSEYALSLARISPSTGRDVTATLVGFMPKSEYQEFRWTKADTLAHFGVLNNVTVRNSQQLGANLFFLRKTPASIALIQRWLDTFRTPQLVNDAPSTIPSRHDEHRHDQSVFSVLRKIHEGTVVTSDIKWTTVSKQHHPAEHVAAERQHKRNNRGKHSMLRG